MFKNDRHNGDGLGASAQDDAPASAADARIDVFLGRTSPVEARVYVRLRDATPGETLGGFVRGPFCRFASTLPTNYTLRQLAATAAGELLAEVIVPEPCFWTPDMPQTYELHLEQNAGPRMLGIRSMGARGRDLIFSGQRWVLRGVHSGAVDAVDLADWRESGAAMVVGEPADALCEEASHAGVVLVAVLRPDAPRPLELLRRLARWPAVILAAVGSETPAGDILSEELRRSPTAARQAAPNLLLGMVVPEQALADAKYSTLPPVDVILVEVDLPETFAGSIANISQPVIALRLASPSASLAEARHGCDDLQKELAPAADCAGYVV